jgi:hypothetical protein
VNDSTAGLQQVIEASIKEAARKASSSPHLSSASIKLEKGDYAIGTLQIPKNSQVILFSKDRVRMLYIGKRNRPMFLLEENSALILREKLEIYYNTNNVREALRLMIRTASITCKVEISKEVRIAFFSQKLEK